MIRAHFPDMVSQFAPAPPLDCGGCQCLVRQALLRLMHAARASRVRLLLHVDLRAVLLRVIRGSGGVQDLYPNRSEYLWNSSCDTDKSIEINCVFVL